jgi:two-component system cell cycle response regulator DivK
MSERAATVLLVDDSELDRDMLSRRLARRGYTVVCATDGAEALAQVERIRPDLVLLDTSLPVVDGLTVTRTLKGNPATRALPVLILTSRAMQQDREQALAAGCDDFDTKPVELPRLLGKIEALLAARVVPEGAMPENVMPAGAVPAGGIDVAERSLALTPLSLDRLAEIRTFLAQSLTELDCAASVDAFVLAVDEICANLVQHAEVGAFPGPTRVTVRREGLDAIITVEDRGRPFDPSDAPAPDLTSDWEDRPVGGLGWFLVKQMVDDLTYSSTPVEDGLVNRLTLIKRHVASGSGPVAPT